MINATISILLLLNHYCTYRTPLSIASFSASSTAISTSIAYP